MSFLLLFLAALAEQQDQQLGTVFPIIEEDLKQVLMTRMSKVDQRLMMEKIQTHMKNRARNPTPIFTNAICKEYRTWTHDPTIMLENDIVNEARDILVPKGTTCNPLHYQKLSTQLVFIDGTIPKQIKWALEQKNALIVLINGSPLDMEEKYKVPIYFDQGGNLCQRFKLEAFPAKVYQEGMMLRCEELVI